MIKGCMSFYFVNGTWKNNQRGPVMSVNSSTYSVEPNQMLWQNPLILCVLDFTKLKTEIYDDS